ncbi:MAG: glycosyltransferase [Bacteroidales bacterium]|nr:glycosyltransferase [Bacteroidales bacterium]
MKVVFLARWYPHKYDPMFGLFVQRHAEAAALHDEVAVVYVHPDENAQNKYDIERSSENSVDTIRIYYRKRGKLSSAWRYYQACLKGLRLAGKPDLIHVHVLTRMGLVAYRQKLLHGTPYIITEHWSRYLPGNDFSGWLRKKLTRKVVKNAQCVTTVSEMLAQAMQSHGLKHPNYQTIPNVVDVNLFKPIPHHNEIPKIVHVSCFEDKSKNISGLLDALKIMKDKGDAFQAVLIGEGMDLEAMKQRALDLKLTDFVRFTGLLQGQDLVDELATGDFFVLPSHYETGGIVLLEAMACGLPVVATRVGALPEIVNDTNGILVAAGDARALAEAMEQCCHTYNIYSKENLRRQVEERYSKEKVGELIHQRYSS